MIFGLLLATSLVYGLIVSFGLEKGPLSSVDAHRRLGGILATETVDTLLVIAAFWVLGSPNRWPAADSPTKPAAWGLGAVGLSVALFLNLGYHRALRAYLGLAPVQDSVVSVMGVTPWVLLAYCVQPAVVEELFFRYLALDTLRGVTSVRSAILVSSVMFGMAHIGQPLSIPVLATLGALLGYSRVASGGLALPVALHFLHNLIVLAID